MPMVNRRQAQLIDGYNHLASPPASAPLFGQYIRYI